MDVQAQPPAVECRAIPEATPSWGRLWSSHSDTLPDMPPSRRSNYISAAGEQRLKDELRYLWSEERPRVTQQVADAAALGDRSENAEYIYGKKRLREIDRRVRYLSKRLEQLTVVRQTPDNQSKVYFGAEVTLEDDHGGVERYRLLGPDEIDLKAGHISIDSPLGRALLGRSLDDEIRLNSPAGPRRYLLVDIAYPTP